MPLMRRLLRFAAALLAAGGVAAFAAGERLEPLPPAQAFGFDARMESGDAVVTFDMPEGIYLYRDKIRVTTATPGFAVADAPLPAGTPHEDPFFGKTTVYYGQLTLRAAVSGGGNFELLVLSQGCDEQVGICYPPQENLALLIASGGGGGEAAAADAGAAEAPAGKDETSALAAGIKDNTIWWTIAIFFLLGVGLSLTPCVLPMLPILLSVIGGGDKTRRRVMLLTAAYIAGVVASFTALGIAAAAAGQLLTAFLQTPVVLTAAAALFIALALSMFGAYNLQMPAALRAKFSAVGGGGGVFGAVLMGGVSAVVVSPCVAAPLIGALLYIAQTGDSVTGGVALMALALGMSVLLAVAGVAGAAYLPKAGAWMNGIKNFFGWLLLLLAVWVASPLLPVAAQMALYGGILIFGGVLAKPFAAPAGVAAAGIKAAALALILWGAMLLAGVALGGRDILTPLSPLAARAENAGEASRSVAFRPVKNLSDLRRELAQGGRPAMLDFYADWCVACKELERFTFEDARVKARLRPLLLLRADVTRNNDDDRRLLKEFGLFGPPALLFFGADGALIAHTRVVGYEDADDFLNTLTAAGL